MRWELPWTPRPGRHELLARATDRRGNTQPDTVPFNEGGYQFWAVVRHPVTAARPEAAVALAMAAARSRSG